MTPQVRSRAWARAVTSAPRTWLRATIFLFETIQAPSIAERIRATCFLPFGAFIAVLLATDMETIIGPSSVFYWVVAAIALTGAFGIGIAVRLAVLDRAMMNFRAFIWLIMCAALSLLCAHMFVALTQPLR